MNLDELFASLPGPWVVGLSGGPDSVFLTHCMITYMQEYNLPDDQLIIAYYHHHTRPGCDEEVRYITSHYQRYRVVIGHYEGQIFTESALRVARHQFFLDTLDACHATVLCLGHHLMDRIETSMMNLMRGCQIPGFLNMSLMSPHYLRNSVTMVRPLITYTKAYILQQLREKNLTYFVDPTNSDPEMSLRNRVRKTLSQGSPALFQQRSDLYAMLSPTNNSVPLHLLSLPPSIGITWCYYFDETMLWTPLVIVALWKQLQLAGGISQSTVSEFHHFLATATHGHKLLGGCYHYRCHNKTYLLKYHPPAISPPDPQCVITTGEFRYHGYVLLMRDENIGLTVRLPLSTDRFHGKSLLTYLSNQKIPVWMRNNIPIGIRDGIIVVVYHQVRSQIMDPGGPR